jgi:hypothetical protein
MAIRGRVALAESSVALIRWQRVRPTTNLLHRPVPVVGIDAGLGTQIAGLVTQRPRNRDDRRLVGRHRIEIAHSCLWDRSTVALRSTPSASRRHRAGFPGDTPNSGESLIRKPGN